MQKHTPRPLPTPHSPPSRTGRPKKERRSLAKRMGERTGEGLENTLVTRAARRDLGSLPGAQGHEPRTEWARSRKELCRPEREGDGEVRRKGDSSLTGGPHFSISHRQ